MHSRLQELKKEEKTLLKIKIMLQDQLNRLKVQINPDDASEINQTKLLLTAPMDYDVEEEEEEDDDEDDEEEEEDGYEDNDLEFGPDEDYDD
ncbi:hypothetical protein CRUP_022492 [Coryphaenoides rupestris]|nr:hypothetical protein CRUP_022492 [Coryphaenoides rupestris]